MKKTESVASRLSRDTAAAGPSAENSVAGSRAKEQLVEVDRRGKPLPPRQRVGGIITPH